MKSWRVWFEIKMISFGPAGLGGVKQAVERLEQYNELGLQACEIAFTYGVYIKESQKKEIKEIKETAEKYDIKLSIHAPYWINLNSEDKEKIKKSKERILRCCKIGHQLGAELVVFHPGYYGKKKPEETYQNIKKQIKEVLGEIKKNKWKIKLAPETTGKVNVFGKEEEILRLVKDTGCLFTIDFAHLYARGQGKVSYKEMYNKVREFKKLHCHFSGITFTKSGERHHIQTTEKMWKELLEVLPKDKDITIINESPDPVGDSVKGMDIWEKLK